MKQPGNACVATIYLSVILTAVCGCREEQDNRADSSTNSPQSVIAVSYPLEFLTQKIAGDSIDVQCIVPAGEDGSSWRPKREDISRMQDADLVVANGRGAEYASWMTIASIPDSRLCESATKGLSLNDYIAVEDIRVVHSHGPEGEHSHATMVAYTWLDPVIASKQAKYISQELARVFPELAGQFEQNYQKLKAELDQLADSLRPLEASSVIVVATNPKLKFLTRAAGLPDLHLNWLETPTLEQAATDLEKLQSQLSANANTDPSTIIWLTSFPVDAPFKNWLSKRDVKLIRIDPLDVRPEHGDYISVMKENIGVLAKAISE